MWRGAAKATTGGLTKNKLTKNKYGKVVSLTKSKQAKRKSNLGKYVSKRGRKTTTKLTNVDESNVIVGKRTRGRGKKRK